MKRLLLLLVPLLAAGAGCGERTTATAVVEGMLRTYQNAKSFTGESTEDLSIRNPGQPQQAKMSHRVAYEAPNRFYTDTRLEGQPIQVLASDGTRVRALDAQNGIVDEAAAPARLVGSMGVLERFNFAAKNHPLAYIAGYNPLNGVEASFSEAERLEGADTHAVLLEGQGSPATTLWIGKKDHLLYQVRQVVPPQLSRFGVEVQATDRQRDLKLDGPVASDLFAFSPPAGARVVPVTYVGAPCPAATLKDLDGKKVDLGALKGKVVLLNFWAFWCGPCRQELPTLQQLATELAPKGVVFLGVTMPDSRDPKWSATRDALRQAGVTYPSLVDATGMLSVAFGVDGLPHTAVIDRNGIVSASMTGLHPESDLREALKKAGS